MAKKALIESTAKEIKEVLKKRVNKTNESLDKPNETTTTTQYKYNYSKKKYNTSRKKPGLPSFEYKQWDFDLLKKIIDKTGEDDEDDIDISNNNSNVLY